MRFSVLTVIAVLTPANAFGPHFALSSKRLAVTAPSVATSTATNRWTRDQGFRTALNMAFEGTPKTSNMFDGPGPLVRERDACGVGVIANTKSGGTSRLQYKMQRRSQVTYQLTRFRIVLRFHSCLPRRMTRYRRVWDTQGPSRRHCRSHVHGAPRCVWRRRCFRRRGRCHDTNPLEALFGISVRELPSTWGGHGFPSTRRNTSKLCQKSD